jgi:hypothetical protein
MLSPPHFSKESIKSIFHGEKCKGSIYFFIHVIVIAKVNNTSPYLKNWIEKDIYIINNLLEQNKQIMSYAIFQDTYHVDTTFVEFYGKM